jgi:hypothetical protein
MGWTLVWNRFSAPYLRFALFEAEFQVICTILTPRFSCASRGANHVAPLRGADGHKDRPCTQTLTGKTLFHLNILDAPHASRQRVEDDLGRLFLAKKISAQ